MDDLGDADVAFTDLDNFKDFKEFIGNIEGDAGHIF
jgi:hypothetical protein